MAPSLLPADLALTPAPAYQLSDVTLYHTLRPGTMAMLLGAKGSGKTQVALSACNAILKGDRMWPLFCGKVEHSENIAYVDAETPYDEYQENLRQHDLTDKVGVRFFGLSLFAPDLPDFCEHFSLNDPVFRDGLTEYLLEHKCRFLILDNLTALMGDAVQQASAATEVLNWVRTLQKYQISIVLVHHKSETDTTNPGQEKARGSQHFEILARSVVSLISKEDILSCAANCSERVQEAAKQDDLTVGLYFRVSKAAPILERKTLWLRLPLGSGEWESLSFTDAGGNECPLPTSDVPAVPTSEEDESKTTLPDRKELPPDERKVLEVLDAGSAKRADIQEKTGFGPDKTRDILNALMDRDWVISRGNGKATCYLLNSES